MPRYLAIDADATGLYVAAATVTRGGVRLDQTLAVGDDNRPLSAATARPIGEQLKQLLKQAGIAPAPVLVCVGRDRVILKEVKIPPASAADEPAVVRFQAMKEMTDAPEDVVVDYMPLPPAGGERSAMVVFLRRDILAAARVMCEAAGLKLAGVTPRPFAAAAATGRAVSSGAVPPPEPSDAAVAVVSLTDRGGEFTVVRGGFVRYARSLSGQAVSSEAALVGELRRNLTVFAGQPGGSEIEAVYLAEADAGGWAGRLRAGLPVPVYSFDPVAGSVAAEMMPAPVRGRFIGPVGLLAARAASTLPINFQQPRQPRAEANPNRRKFVLAGVVAAALLAAAGFGGYLMVNQAESRANALRLQVQQVDDEIARFDIEEKRLAAADDYKAREVVWLDELYDLSDRFPDIDKMRVTKLVGSAVSPPSEKERQKEEAALKDMTAAQKAKLPPKPVAKLQLTVTAENNDLPGKLVSSFDSERRYFTGTRSIGGGLIGAAGSKSQLMQFTIETLVAHRKPEDYRRRLTVKPPAIVAPVPAAPEGTPASDDDQGMPIPVGPGFGGGTN